MSYRAWIYIAGVILAGLSVSVLALTETDWQLVAWHPVILLLILATLAQIVKADGPNHVAFFATPIFLFAGLLLLQPGPFVLLVTTPHVIEWGLAWKQKSSHLRAWYIQPFNIAKHIIAGIIAQFIVSPVPGGAAHPSMPTAIESVLLAAVVFLVVNEGLLAQALVLARGVSWRDSGVMTLSNLGQEFVLLCMGMIIAEFWVLKPWMILPSLAPLVLIYRALKVPKLIEEAQTDDKTGLYNAKQFKKLFAEEFERAKRFNRPLAIIMADLDLLRNINNNYGHLAGDIVLEGIGKIVRSNIRDYDIAGRFGGEEFAIAVPEASELEAQLLAERLRQMVEATPFTVSTSSMPIHVTMSLGVAYLSPQTSSMADLINEADVAVYQAKSQGRNRVVRAADLPKTVKLEQLWSLQVQDAAYPAALAAQADAAGSREVPAVSSRTAEAAPATEEARPGASAVAAADASAQEQAQRRTGYRLYAFVGCVIAAGLCVTAVSASLASPPGMVLLAVLIILAVCAELRQISVYGDHTISASMAVIFAAGLLAGMPGVIAVSGAIAAAAHVRQGRSLHSAHKMVFNWATHILAASPLVYVYNIAQLSLQPERLLGLSFLIVLCSILYYLIETGLISVAISLSKRTGLLWTWQMHFRWLVSHYVMLGLMGQFLSMAYMALGMPGILVFVLPLALTRYAQQQYVERTWSSVQELQRMNQELAQANREILHASAEIQKLNADLRKGNMELDQLNNELFETLARFFDARDPYVGGHAAQVARYATAIAEDMGLTGAALQQVRQAALLHDIGKIAIPEQILNKPSRLTQEEYRQVQLHTIIGAELLEVSQSLRHLAPYVRYHHERWDGNGYPDGLAGEQIPLVSRILNLCDSVEAMASDRPYHKALPASDVLAEVRRCAGSQFDPAVAGTFVRLIERHGDSYLTNSAREVMMQRLLVNPAGATSDEYRELAGWSLELTRERNQMPLTP